MVTARNNVQILIIDDDDFPYLSTLLNDKYRITHIEDIEDYNAVSEYQVVICDVIGVGHKFSENQEGAFVVKELKKRFPFKKYAVYSSASNYNLAATDDMEGIKRIKKDVDIDMWRSYLDTLIDMAYDPIEIWKTIRNFLLSKNVSLKEVLLLESNFVDIYINRPKDMKQFPEQNMVPNLSPDIKGVVQSMIAGGLLHMIGI